VKRCVCVRALLKLYPGYEIPSQTVVQTFYSSFQNIGEVGEIGITDIDVVKAINS